MFGKSKDRLNAREVEEALVRLRGKHDDYIVSTMAGRAEKNAFEERYIHALHARVNLTLFIQDEIAYIQQLFRKHEEAEELAFQNRQKAAKPQMSFADKVMAENEKKIESYPILEFSSEAAVEVKKLYGALDYLDKEYWQVLSSFVRKYHSSSICFNLENRLNRMIAASGDTHIPADLDRYIFLLSQKSTYTSELFRESQECIKRASFFLHELKHTLDSCRNRGLMDENVEIAYKYIENIILDFRLKDLKQF